ncbi:MAG: Rubrerythrin [Candidatus Moranbacteria bacterium GW2011_GWF2_34_56]|nr:MAG: Rubrerythrin [Candidatus Moranbacteria bacterium GW2011_GWF1_34_10]KKP64293.1 MAG: Rubrerythrin [Candidatus Moranbacteria bacterium GW2011_GWF2_34_56]HBI17367.1 rubrerythrin family protein [Candidatus Moranbacteria bacterium]
MQKTIENLTKAFIGESQARNRYSMYAKIAKNEGYEQISAIFEETADQEREHAKQLFKMINELKKESGENKYEEIIVEASAPTAYGTTIENLKSAAHGEHYEHETMYPEFSALAKEEGLVKIAARLTSIAKAEAHHEERYLKLLSNIEKDTVFKKEIESEWTCRKCGYTHTGKNAPLRCPACDHPAAYCQIKCEQY